MDWTELEEETIRAVNEQFFAVNLNLGQSQPVANVPARNPILTNRQSLNMAFAIISTAIAIGALIIIVRSRNQSA